VSILSKYADAKTYCNANFKGMAIIYNETYQHYLNETIARSGLGQNMWIGAETGTYGSYYWVDGPATSTRFENWMPSEPLTNMGSVWVGPESTGYRWGTSMSSSKLFFICAI